MKSTLIGCLCLWATVASADSYSMWAGEVESASRGLQICGDAYFETIAGSTKPSDVPRLTSEARKTCGVLKNNLNATMLAVRTRVDDSSGELAKYHRSILEAFEAFVPVRGVSPLEYKVQTQEVLLLLAKRRGQLSQILGY
jgi:hypothetical protein